MVSFVRGSWGERNAKKRGNRERSVQTLKKEPWPLYFISIVSVALTPDSLYPQLVHTLSSFSLPHPQTPPFCSLSTLHFLCHFPPPHYVLVVRCIATSTPPPPSPLLLINIGNSTNTHTHTRTQIPPREVTPPPFTIPHLDTLLCTPRFHFFFFRFAKHKEYRKEEHMSLHDEDLLAGCGQIVWNVRHAHSLTGPQVGGGWFIKRS